MDASSSPPEPEAAPEPPLELSPSSRGRQRKKNPKFDDYLVSEVYDGQTSPRKCSRRSLTSPKGQPHVATDGEQEEQEEREEQEEQEEQEEREEREEQEEQEVQEVQEKLEKLEVQEEQEEPKKAPKRRVGRPRKNPPGRKTPGKTSAAADQNGEGATENETPKPKRKYTKRKREEERKVEEVKETEAAEEEESETIAGARPKRGAARAALKYLHRLAKDELQHSEDQPNQANGEGPLREPALKTQTPRKPGGRGRKRKCLNNSDTEDFVEEEEDEDEEDDEEDEEEEKICKQSFTTTRNQSGGQRVNGLPFVTRSSIALSTQTNTKFRQDCHSSWVFPDWIPSSTDWQLLSQSEGETYLPQEQQSVQFSVSREGLKKEEPQELHRFSSLPSHADRWDSVLFCGGPVWSLEWCPTPDQAKAEQYLALSCHRNMDEKHRVNQVYSGPGLVQVWSLGSLQCDRRPDSQPTLAYCLAQDRGFVWGLKWCPAGAWEPPDADKQAPLMPRLGLLAVASSLGLVTVYSLPHPDALIDSLSPSDRCDAQVFKAKALVTLRLGSFKAPRLSDSGQVLSLDWLPHKPHNLIAIGFFDGHVGLWDLVTHSSLLRVKEADGSMTLLPYECFLAHDLPVRHVSFYPASRTLLVTAGEDRYIKTWDTTRLFEPVTQQKRNLNNEICWPLYAPGLLVSEEAAYAAFKSHGVHFYDHHMTALFPIPRAGTMWSMAYSDWLNIVVTGDTLGQMVLCTLPLLSLQAPNCKRTIERRFPLQFSSLEPLQNIKEETSQKVPQTETAAEGEEGGTGSGPVEHLDQGVPHRLDTYRDAVQKYSLSLTDFNMRSVLNFERRPLWKKMRSLESSASLGLDDFPLAAVHKVRFSPNFSSHTWVASGGQSGLVRLFCVQCVNFKTTASTSEPEEAQPTPTPGPETGSEPGHTDPAPDL